MSETTITVKNVTNKKKQKQDEKLVQFGCMMCGNMFYSESDCDQHIANCLENTLSERDPLEFTNIKAPKRKFEECENKTDSTNVFEDSTPEESSDPEQGGKKIREFDTVDLKQEQDNDTLEGIVYGATSQMISENEMLITLPYDQGTECSNEPLDFANEVAIDFEEHTEKFNHIQLEYKPEIFNENTNGSDQKDSTNLIIEDFDNVEQNSNIKILSVFVKPPQTNWDSHPVVSHSSETDTVSTGNIVEISETGENKNNVNIFSSVNVANHLDTEQVAIIDIPSPTEVGEREYNNKLKKEVKCEKSDDEHKNLEIIKFDNTGLDQTKKESRKYIVLRAKNQKQPYNNNRKYPIMGKRKRVRYISKEELLNSKDFFATLKTKLTENLTTNQGTPKSDNSKKTPQKNRKPQHQIEPQKPGEQPQNKKKPLKPTMYKEIKGNEIKFSEKLEEFSVYEFFDEEEEKLREKIQEDMEKDKAIRARTCRFCHELFDDPIEVLRHRRIYHVFKKIQLTKEEIEPYLKFIDQRDCPLCHKVLGTKAFKSVYLKHIMTHCDEYNFECRVCGMQFRRKDHWTKHESRHVVLPESV